MDKRFLEIIYEDYLNEINISPEEEFEEDKPIISEDLKNKILEMFKEKEEPKLTERKIEEGNVYLFFKGHIPVYFLIYKYEGDYYTVLKISNYFELANQNDLITQINDEIFAVETWNSFYLTEEEIENSIYYGRIAREDFEIIKQFKERKIKELPEGKRGLKAPLGDNIQTKFHEKESEIVREFKLRVIEELMGQGEVILDLPPDREKYTKMPLAAGKEKTLVRKDKFIIRKDKENNIIEIVFIPEITNKKAKIKYFDDYLEFEELPERIYIKPVIDLESIDLEKLAQNIEVEI